MRRLEASEAHRTSQKRMDQCVMNACSFEIIGRFHLEVAKVVMVSQVAGFGGSIEYWRRLIPALSAEGYTVHAFDLLGLGIQAGHFAVQISLAAIKHFLGSCGPLRNQYRHYLGRTSGETTGALCESRLKVVMGKWASAGLLEKGFAQRS